MKPAFKIPPPKKPLSKEYKSLLEGDGRLVLAPRNAPEGTKPMPLRRAQARVVVSNFLQTGESHHSQAGSTVWAVVTYCIETGNEYKVANPLPAGGWIVTLLGKKEPDPQ